MLTDAGTSRERAAAIAGLIGLSVVAGRVLVGRLFDWLFAPRVAAVVLVLTTIGWWPLAEGTPGGSYIAAIAIGFSVGAEIDILSYLTARYFGVAAYGRVYGVLYGAMLIGSASSSFWVGAAYDHFGSYRPALVAATVIMAIATSLLVALPRFEGEQGESRPGGGLLR
jgi:predicted MFS family arabinose efflux permease